MDEKGLDRTGKRLKKQISIYISTLFFLPFLRTVGGKITY